MRQFDTSLSAHDRMYGIFYGSQDSPELFAMMEKSRIYLFRGLNPEEPLASTSHLYRFCDLEITTVNLDGIMGHPEEPTMEEFTSFEARSLR